MLSAKYFRAAGSLNSSFDKVMTSWVLFHPSATVTCGSANCAVTSFRQVVTAFHEAHEVLQEATFSFFLFVCSFDYKNMNAFSRAPNFVCVCVCVVKITPPALG